MTTAAQKTAVKKGVRKAQSVSQATDPRPRGRSRAKSGVRGEGDYYRIILRPSKQFRVFRTQDVGKPGLAGKRTGGSWVTQAWLVSKSGAHVEGRRLIADNKDVSDLIRRLGSEPMLEKGDIFTAKDRSNYARKR